MLGSSRATRLAASDCWASRLFFTAMNARASAGLLMASGKDRDAGAMVISLGFGWSGRTAGGALVTTGLDQNSGETLMAVCDVFLTININQVRSKTIVVVCQTKARVSQADGR